jgi:hypothetical protein
VRGICLKQKARKMNGFGSTVLTDLGSGALPSGASLDSTT